MFGWIYDLPTWLSALIFAVAFPGVTLVGLLIFRRLLSRWIHRETRANDMVSMALASFSVMYGILVGLVAVGAYTHYDAMNNNVSAEASALASLYRDTFAFPEPLGHRLQQDIRDYTRDTIEVGWPAQRRGETPTGGTQRVSQLFVDLVSFQPKDERDQAIFSEVFYRYNQLIDLRRERLAAVTTGLPAVLWWVMMLGAVLNIILIWMLNMEIHVHVVLATVLSLFLGSVIFLTAVLDLPFRGEVSVSPEPLQLVDRTLMGGT
jgi:Protein of unknown function (DUF4239)